jgi:lipoate---protein ligase
MGPEVTLPTSNYVSLWRNYSVSWCKRVNPWGAGGSAKKPENLFCRIFPFQCCINFVAFFLLVLRPLLAYLALELESKRPPESAQSGENGSMHRNLSSGTITSACKRLSILQPYQLSTSSCRPTLISVDTIRDKVSKFVVRSTTTDPFLNLAIEDHLLRTSHPESHILFTYVNRPCVVIGRNQNPWLEVNLAALKPGVPPEAAQDGDRLQGIVLVRRRSGGGTVFHDEGNLNYSFIVPNDKNFNRNKHAEMVVSAIKGISPDLTYNCQQLLSSSLKEGIRVNERHDIVMPARADTGPALLEENQTVKVSGSAYKLIRGRALHHGTLLFSSPNLKSIGGYLRSPARGFIDAKGVDSVRSPIGNLRFSYDLPLRDALREEIERSIAGVFRDKYSGGVLNYGSVDQSDANGHAAINSGVTELRSEEWKYLQTPAFTFTNEQLPGENFKPARQPDCLPTSMKMVLKAKHGIITESHISLSDNQDVADAEAQQIRSFLQDKKLHSITSWEQVFAGLDKWTHPSTGALIAWLSEMFPPVPG